MSETAFDDYLVQWRGASPERAIAWLFLRPGERVCFGALAALEHEWLKVVREAREPQVAAARLGWWREEMQRATQGQARHPLTQGLFALPAKGGSDPTATRAATRELMLDRQTGQPVKDETLTMHLSELRSRISRARQAQ